ncbi:hypothetical protein [Leptospira noguchii]|uniref:hypothetical protein n=1 Tax=Leptospira noguchii TaxID=28182 RepID=UPI001FB644AB|nr:hypothetical protein [Leptospira noguchii]UOG45397.1 hypothetical protein MAL01_01635 [Leptospira noguchii]UOG52913.1 hypothetical protein MAL09_01375 [Leptospira noguchii]
MERKELNETLFTKAFETQHNAHYGSRVNSASHSPWVVRSKLSVSLPMGRSK